LFCKIATIDVCDWNNVECALILEYFVPLERRTQKKLARRGTFQFLLIKRLETRRFSKDKFRRRMKVMMVVTWRY